MIFFRVTSILSISALLSACASAPESFETQYTPCETLDLLIKGHSTNFDALKVGQKSSKKMTVWKAKYNAIGENCQIWEWGAGSSTYTCNEVFPNETLALEKYNAQNEGIQTCLNDTWQAHEEPRSMAKGMRTVYSKPGQKTHVALHVIETKDLLKKVWTVYYFVGDTEKAL